MRTIASDYASSLVRLADSIERSPDCPALREGWIETLKDTCPLHEKSDSRSFLFHVLDRVGVENPPQRAVDLVRVLSYVVKRAPNHGGGR